MKKETSTPSTKSLHALTAGMSDDDKKIFITKYSSTKDMRERIALVLLDRLEKAIKKEEKEELYDTANWQYIHADSVGYRRALREAISLLTFNYEVDHDR